jgi:hypothetical protein
MSNDDDRRFRLDLWLDREDYEFLSFMIYDYKCKNRSAAARVCIKTMREWMEHGRVPDETHIQRRNGFTEDSGFSGHKGLKIEG